MRFDKLTAKFQQALQEGQSLALAADNAYVLVKPRRTLLSENFHTPMDSFHCWLYEAV